MNLVDVRSQFIGRAKQIKVLEDMFGRPNDTSSGPGSLFIHGAPATGKTATVKAMFAGHLEQGLAAYANCKDAFEPRLLFERLVNGLAKWTPSIENGYSSYRKCILIVDFVKAVADVVKEQVKVHEDIYQSPLKRRYLIVDDAECLRSMKPSGLLPVFLRLSQLTGVNVDVILISNISWDHFEDFSSAITPMQLHFPAYTQEQVLHILARDRPEGEDLMFYVGFIHIIYQQFHRGCRNLNEFKYIASLLYPKYVEPVKFGNVDPSEKGKLHKHLEGTLEDFARQLYLREMSSLEWEKESSAKERIANLTKAINRQNSSTLELPYYSKYLLISAFLASYNPAKLDQRYFTKAGEARAKKKGGATRKGRISKKDVTRQQLIGPKLFPVERMLAIFYALIDAPIESNVEIQGQIMTLVNLRLLIRASTADNLDAMKLKCNVSYEMVKEVAQKVRLNIDHYLHEWE